MATGAPDHYKTVLLHGVDASGNPAAVLVDEAGRIIFRSVTEYEVDAEGSNPTVAAGDLAVNSTVVPTGQRWIVSSVACANRNTMNSSVQIYARDGVSNHLLKSQNSPAPLESTDWQGSLVLAPGWNIRFVFNGCAQDDTLYWAIIYTVVED